MFVPDDAALVGNGHDDLGSIVQNDALAAEPALDAGVDRAINEIFLFVRDFFQKLLAALDAKEAKK